MKQILIAGPTAKAKNYCLEDWLMHLNSLHYPRFAVLLADNTPDNGENRDHIQAVAESLPLIYPFMALHVKNSKSMPSLHERIAAGHNLCRKFAIDKKYQFWLHLESDVFPPQNVIEELLAHQRKIIGAMYYRDEGKFRKLMVQRHIYAAPNRAMGVNVDPSEDTFILDGTVKKFAHVGLGCCMLHSKVFSGIKFRHKPGVDAAPDSWFAADCAKKGFEIYGHTGLLCDHRNQSWGKYGVDFE